MKNNEWIKYNITTGLITKRVENKERESKGSYLENENRKENCVK